jgi:hypothetical protein
MRHAYIFAAALASILLTANTANAELATCVRELPNKRTEHWSYRFVQGQKCWFPDSARTAQRAIKKEPKAPVQATAPPSSAPKSNFKVMTGPLESSSSAARSYHNDRSSALADHIIPSISSPKLSSAPELTEAWNERAIPRGPAHRNQVATTRFTLAGSSEPEATRLPSTAQEDLSTILFKRSLSLSLGIMLGVCLIGISASRALRSRCGPLIRKLMSQLQQSRVYDAFSHLGGRAIGTVSTTALILRQIGLGIAEVGASAWRALRSCDVTTGNFTLRPPRSLALDAKEIRERLSWAARKGTQTCTRWYVKAASLERH